MAWPSGHAIFSGARILSIGLLADGEVVFGMLAQKICGKRADDVYAKIVLLRIVECGLGELRSDTLAPHAGSHFCVPDRHPALAICVEFEIRDFPMFFDFEPASCDLVGLAGHGSTLAAFLPLWSVRV